ncbi:MAG: glycosyl transferase family 9, partial [Bacteroidota bacterium]
MANFQHIAIARTDGIGDVILTLPLAVVLKNHFPGCKISFIGKTYTQSIIEACEYVDDFIDVANLDEVLLSRYIPDAIFHVFPDINVMRWAKKTGIPKRIGTMKRWSSLGNINSPLFFSRKKSDLHEAQLNLKMLSAIGLDHAFSVKEIGKMVTLKPQSVQFNHVPPPTSKTIVLHPLSHGSALEWPKERFAELANIFIQQGLEV